MASEGQGTYTITQCHLILQEMNKTKLVKVIPSMQIPESEMLFFNQPVILMYFTFEHIDGYLNLVTYSMNPEQFYDYIETGEWVSNTDTFPIEVMKPLIITAQYREWVKENFEDSKCPYSPDDYFNHFAKYNMAIVSKFLNSEACEIYNQLHKLSSLKMHFLCLLNRAKIAIGILFIYLKMRVK